METAMVIAMVAIAMVDMETAMEIAMVAIATVGMETAMVIAMVAIATVDMETAMEDMEIAMVVMEDMEMVMEAAAIAPVPTINTFLLFERIFYNFCILKNYFKNKSNGLLIDIKK